MRAAIASLFVTGCLIGPQPGFGDSPSDGGSGGGTVGDTSTGTDATDSDDTNDATTSTGELETDTDDLPMVEPIPRGYLDRPCGFDLNHNGVPGESGECDVCDGVTAEPFPHDYPQRLIYIDCDNGTDSETCGSPDEPCATLGYPTQGVWNTEEETGQQYILCFAGTCPGSLLEQPNGWTAPVTHEKQGSDAWDFDYPEIPTLLSGWDRDDDGEYPPHDDDDVAEIDLDAAGGGGFIVLSGSSYYRQSHDLEFAHFTVKNGADSSSKFIHLSSDTMPARRIHVHDIVLDGVHGGASASSDRPIIGLSARQYQGAAGSIESLALENIHLDGIAGWFVSETSDQPTLPIGPIRMKNIGARWDGCPVGMCDQGAVPVFWRASGYFQKVELIDSMLEGNTEAWDPWIGADPDDASKPATAFTVAECNRDFAIRNNAFSGFATAVRVEANSQLNPCNTIDVAGVVIEGNEVAGSGYVPLSRVTVPFYVSDGSSDLTIDAHVGDVRIVNNAVVVEHGWRACAGVRVSGSGSGPIVFEHDTCVGALTDPSQGSAHFWVRVPLDGSAPVDDITLGRVLFAGASPGDLAVLVGTSPAGWLSDHNVFDPDATFAWAADIGDLDAWRTWSGGDAASDACVPAFVDANDFHLGDADACAADRGGEVDGVAKDIDGEMRPMGPASDVGADERP